MATQEIRVRYARTGERRAVNAKRIARYLSDTAVTEKSLLQRKRQQEMHDARRYRVVKDRRRTEDNRPLPESDDIWGANTRTILEDLV